MFSTWQTRQKEWRGGGVNTNKIFISGGGKNIPKRVMMWNTNEERKVSQQNQLELERILMSWRVAEPRHNINAGSEL